MNLPSVNQIPESSSAAFEDCTVTAIAPLRIKRDADTSELAFTPGTLVNTAFLTIGDRVRVDISRKPMLVVGRADGLAGVDTIVARDAAILVATRGQIPSSVTVGSGSATVAADGTVTFTGVSSVSLNGVFDGLGGDVYDVDFYAVTSTGATIYTRLRAGGTDDSGATSYVRTGSYSQLAAGPTRYSSTGANVFGNWCPTLAGTGSTVAGRMTLFKPKRAVLTRMFMTVLCAISTPDLYDWTEKGTGPATAFDAISFIVSTGTMAGTAKVVKRS